MDEIGNKLYGIKTIPIFPLPAVLFPHEIFPLHIFEPRYRQMLMDIADTGDLFGVSYFDPQTNKGDLPAVGTVGCVAEILDRNSSDDGTSNIVTKGLVRYRLIEYLDLGTTYNVAKVEIVVDLEGGDTSDLADEVYDLFIRLRMAILELSGIRGELPAIEKMGPEELSFHVSSAIYQDLELRYDLLSMVSTRQRLEKLRGLLLDSVAKAEEIAVQTRTSQTNGHGKKKFGL